MVLGLLKYLYLASMHGRVMGRQTIKQCISLFFKVGDNESVPTCPDPENSVSGS